MKRFLSLAFSGAFVAAGFGCTSLLDDGSYVGVSRLGDRSTAVFKPDAEDEKTAEQRQHLEIIATYGGVYDNRATEIMLARMAARLLVVAGEGNSGLIVTILDSDEVNAFALPGGYIYVTRGILALANDEAELAAVIAHEIAHLTLRHGRERSNRERTGKIVDRVISGVLGLDPETDQSAARSRLSMMAFSQAQELAADREGIRIAAKAGYDPYAAGRFLGVMSRFSDSGTQESVTEDFLSSHPSMPNRIKLASKVASGYGVPGIGITARERYLAAIDGIAFGPNPRNGTVADRNYLHPDLGFMFRVPEEYALSNRNSAVVAVAKDDMAVRFDSVFVPQGMSLVDYIRSGWVSGLDESSIKSVNWNVAETVTASAKTARWAFEIAVLRFDDRIYRFVFAARETSNKMVRNFESTVKSFREIRNSDLEKIQHFAIDIVVAGRSTSVDQLVRRMRGVDDATRLFYALNGLGPEDQLVTDKPYKIVVASQ